MNIRFLAVTLFLIANTSCFAQSKRLPELRSCLTSEFAVAVLENTDYKKSFQENEEIGKRLGYVLARYYQTSLWALDNPEVETKDAVYYAMNKAEERIKYVSKKDLQSEVTRCRASFAN